MAVALAGLLLNLLLQQFANEESGRLQMVLQQSQLHLPGLFLQLLKAGGRKRFGGGRRPVLTGWIFSIGIGRLCCQAYLVRGSFLRFVIPSAPNRCADSERSARSANEN
jgi:hypothetical protein